jgi:hypothetical protein
LICTKNHSIAADLTDKMPTPTPERYLFSRDACMQGPIARNFKLLYSRQLSTELRSETLERLLSTEAIASETLAFVLGGRLFGLKKTKGYSLGKKWKNERFSKRLRLSRNLHRTTGFDQ